MEISPDRGNIRKNDNSDLSIVTMRRVAIICFELGVITNFMQKFNRKTLHDNLFV